MGAMVIVLSPDTMAKAIDNGKGGSDAVAAHFEGLDGMSLPANGHGINEVMADSVGIKMSVSC